MADRNLYGAAEPEQPVDLRARLRKLLDLLVDHLLEHIGQPNCSPAYTKASSTRWKSASASIIGCSTA